MKKDIKEEPVPCEICGYPVIHNEYGFYQNCPKCGWRRGGDNTELEQQWGISYPMLVALSHAREQYKQGLPFKADFDEFIQGLFFYSEMLFDYQGATYEVFLKGDEKSILLSFAVRNFSKNIFRKKIFVKKQTFTGNV